MEIEVLERVNKALTSKNDVYRGIITGMMAALQTNEDTKGILTDIVNDFYEEFDDLELSYFVHLFEIEDIHNKHLK